MCSLKVDKKHSLCSHKIPLIMVASEYWSDQQRRRNTPKLHKLSKHTSVILMTRRGHKFVRVIKSRRMRWVGHVARMGEGRVLYKVLAGRPEGGRPWGGPGVNGRIILRWISRKWNVGVWAGSSWLKWQARVNAVMNFRVP